MKVLQNSSERRERLINQLAMTDGLSHTSIFNSAAMGMDDTTLMDHKSQSNQHRSLVKTVQVHP